MSKPLCAECGCRHFPGENTLCPGFRAAPEPDPRLAWLTNSLKDLVHAHTRKAQGLRERAERMREPYDAYCRHLAKLHDEVAGHFRAALNAASLPLQSGDQSPPDTAEPAEKQPDSR